MSEKNLDSKGRFRSLTIAFRVSPEENQQINRMVQLSGLTKQDYLTNNMLHHSFTVVGNTRVFKGLRVQMEAVYDELSRLSSASEISDELFDVIKTIASIVDGMRNTGGRY